MFYTIALQAPSLDPRPLAVSLSQISRCARTTFRLLASEGPYATHTIVTTSWYLLQTFEIRKHLKSRIPTTTALSRRVAFPRTEPSHGWTRVRLQLQIGVGRLRLHQRLTLHDCSLGVSPERNVRSCTTSSRTMSTRTSEDSRIRWAMDNHLTRAVDDFHQHQRFYHRGAYRKLGTSFLCFFFCVTRLKPFLVASKQTSPFYPTTTCHLGGSPGTSSVGLTCLVAIRTDTWPPLWAPTSLFRASRSHITRRATRSGRHRLRLCSRFDVPSQCSSKPHPHRQLVPSLGPFRGRFVRLLV